MTISVQQSTATADLQVSGKALTEGEAVLKDGAETGAADNVFSNLLSTLTGSNKSAKKTSSETVASAAKMAKGAGEMAAKTAESALDTSSEGKLDKLAFVDGDALPESSVDPISDEKSETVSESSDDFLARLDQSAQLLQTPAPAQASAQQMSQTAPETLSADGAAILDASGNGLPSLATVGNLGSEQQAKLAGVTTANGSETPITNSQLSGGAAIFGAESSPEAIGLSKAEGSSEETGLSEAEGSSEATGLSAVNQPELSAASPLQSQSETEQLAATAGLAGGSMNNPESLNPQLLASGAKPESIMAGGLAGVGQQSATQVADGVRSGGKNKPLESLNAAISANSANSANSAVSANLAATAEQTDVADSADAVSTEQIEQVDFSQLMDSVRKQEQPELAPRVITRTPVLTEAEQQILDKRVNLHNNSATSELHEKISIMAGKELQTATIRLDPAELGSLNIKLVVHNDQANVIIQAQNGQSRDLLEQQLPRLREMLQQQGIALGDTLVQADSGRQQQSGFQQSGQQASQNNSNNSSNNGNNSSNNGHSSTNYAVDSQTEVPVSSQYWQDSAKGVDFYA